ncbi:MAG: hypothetical protein ACK5ZO_14945 [Gemmatimonas sp.]|jgi:hypothetical protein|uniref:hypothetical protein n=1 Tax=Gemmatimonas sp. TaxID=1962908 RepID=UPI0022C22F30|nr:hypothetical protein [Gemmatimonas sp.]MCZ8013618.1 hypothetical protein [Gemmatimonas sp.]MCZ8265875.1 hypothetical protein [Gemmatimonas sp.]
MTTVTRTTLALSALVILGACTREPESVNDQQVAARIPVDTPVASPPPDLVDSATGVLARRVEPQQYFDATRAALAAKEPERARSGLLAAARFLDRQADSSAGAVREQLRLVARDIDTLAAAVARQRDVSARRLDHVVARANLAESDRHLARVASAWTARDTARTADELLMAADHLERAATDGRIPENKARSAATAAARSLATDLLQRQPDAPDRLPRTQDALRAASRAVYDRLQSSAP